MMQVHATYKRNMGDGESTIQTEVYMGKWNPHLDGNQFSLISGQSVEGIDIRNMQSSWKFKSAHKFQVRDVDFNPNKQYYFATCGDDCATRFWDIRKPNDCLKEVYEHSHWSVILIYTRV